MDSKINLKKSLKSNTAALCPLRQKIISEIGEICGSDIF